jgi:hypothetical protein
MFYTQTRAAFAQDLNPKGKKRMNTFKKIIGSLFKAALLTLLALILIPVLYFAWRANQPMEMAEFNGLSYTQYMNWRKMAHEEVAIKYSHDHGLSMEEQSFLEFVQRAITEDRDHLKTVKVGICYENNAFFDKGRFLSVGPYVLDVYRVQGWPEGWLGNFLPDWWRTFEEWIWSWARVAEGDLVAYCRLRPDIPSVEQYEIMKANYSPMFP